jgi:hypothetical protein
MKAPHGQTGVLVIRAWREGDPPSLVMRVTRTSDVTAREDETKTTTSDDEVLAIVRNWLHEVRTP